MAQRRKSLFCVCRIAFEESRRYFHNTVIGGVIKYIFSIHVGQLSKNSVYKMDQSLKNVQQEIIYLFRDLISIRIKGVGADAFIVQKLDSQVKLSCREIVILQYIFFEMYFSDVI